MDSYEYGRREVVVADPPQRRFYSTETAQLDAIIRIADALERLVAVLEQSTGSRPE